MKGGRKPVQVVRCVLTVLAAMAVICVALAPVGPAAKAEEEHYVKPKRDRVAKNAAIDKNDATKVFPESVATDPTGKVTITTKTFRPPKSKKGKWTFAEFDDDGTPQHVRNRLKNDINPSYYVDLVLDPDWLIFAETTITVSPDNEDAIKVEVAKLTMPDNAGSFPLQCEGNLKPPTGGEGYPPHWSAKMPTPSLEVFIGQSDQIFDEANFEVMLTDYPAEGERQRNPKYMFGKEDPVFIQVRNIEPGQGTLLRRIRVSSESAPSYVEITLKETATDSGVYRNVAGEWSDLLYLGEESGGAPTHVGVIDEEVIKFQLVTSSGEYADIQAEYHVMVDRAECGSGYYNYIDVPKWPQLNSTTDIHNDFLGMLTDTKAGYSKPDPAPILWSTYAGAGDAVCRKNDYAEPTDTDKADAADIIIWSGHGTDTGTPNNYYCAFLDASKNIQKLHHSDVRLGNADAEWAIFQTCRFLNTSKEESNGPGHGTATDEDIINELKQMFAGCHLVCGYKTKNRMYAHFAEKLISCINCDQGSDHGLDVGSIMEIAFIRATRHCPMRDQDMYPRIFVAVDCRPDWLYSEGTKKLAPVTLSRDPLPTDNYHFYEWKVPQAD